MVKLKFLRNLFRNAGVFCIVATLLVACGGGIGNGLPKFEAKPEPTSWTRPTYKAGDYFSFKSMRIDTSSASNPQTYTYFTNQFYTQVGTDNSKTVVAYDSDSDFFTKINYSSSNSVLSLQYGTSICNYTGEHYFDGHNTLSIGLTWNINSIQNCGGSLTEINYKGNVIGLETITIALGTFKTIKYAKTYTNKSGSYPRTTDSTCWRDTVTGRDVKCMSQVTPIFTPTSFDSYNESYELVGYSFDNIQRAPVAGSYAGNWTGGYAGADNGNCKINITLEGNLSGSCSGGKAGVFNISGKVADGGKITFNLNQAGNSGPVFSGQFVNPSLLNGLWTGANGTNGTWTISRVQLMQ